MTLAKKTSLPLLLLLLGFASTRRCFAKEKADEEVCVDKSTPSASCAAKDEEADTSVAMLQLQQRLPKTTKQHGPSLLDMEEKEREEGKESGGSEAGEVKSCVFTGTPNLPKDASAHWIVCVDLTNYKMSDGLVTANGGENQTSLDGCTGWTQYGGGWQQIAENACTPSANAVEVPDWGL